MSFFDKPFTADASQAATGYTPVPVGEYEFIVEKSEIGKSKANNDMLKLCFKITKGDYEDRKIFTNLNLEHANPVVVDIAKKQLNALLCLCGMKEINDPADLIGQVLTAKLKIKRDDRSGELQNEIVLALPSKDAKTSLPEGESKADPKSSGPSKQKW